MKLALLISSCILIFINYATSLNIECDYNNDFNYMELGKVYRCEVSTNPNIVTRETANITSISGSHKSGHNNDNVLAFFANDLTIYYFPSGLESIFKNLKLISIEETQLKEVHQSDLKPFPQLEFLCLARNDIETLEEDLFEFNPNLKLVMFYMCKITHIDPNVFDHLDKMTYLLLSSNPCIQVEARDDRKHVERIIGAIQNRWCINSSIKKKEKIIETTTEMTTMSTGTTQTKDAMKTDTCLALESKVDELLTLFQELIKPNNLQCEAVEKNVLEMVKKVGEIHGKILKLDNVGILEAVNAKSDKIEKKIEELEEKIDKQFARIMRALKIDP